MRVLQYVKANRCHPDDNPYIVADRIYTIVHQNSERFRIIDEEGDLFGFSYVGEPDVYELFEMFYATVES